MSLNCEVEESVYLFRLLRPVFIDEIDNILACLLSLVFILDLIEALGGGRLGLQQPVYQVGLRCVLSLVNLFLYIFHYLLCAPVCIEVSA